MAAQNAWRLVFSASNGGQYIQLTEVAFLDSNGADLSVGGVASASSEYNATYSAAKAFDKSAGTDWCTVANALPAWLQYMHASAVEVAQVRITCSANSAWLPPSASQVGLYGGSSQQDRYTLTIASGSFTPNTVVVLNAAPYVPPPIKPVPTLGYLQGLPAAAFAGVIPTPANGRLLQNYLRPQRPSTGVVADRAMLVSSPGAPEQAFAGARIWLLRLTDGGIAWQGYSDAQGYYRAEGLELGERYIAVGIDPTGQHKSVGAGPVTAELLP